MKHKNLSQDEYDLISGLRNGDHQAFSVLYEKYRPLLASFLRKMNIQDEMIKEIVQVSFQRLWEFRGNLSADKPLQAYLFQIAKHTIYSEVRKNARQETYLFSLSSNSFAETADRHQELQELLLSAVESLSDKRKEVFKLSRFEGYSNQEISEKMGLSKSTVENHINAALKNIRIRLERNGFLTSALLFFNFFH